MVLCAERSSSRTRVFLTLIHLHMSSEYEALRGHINHEHAQHPKQSFMVTILSGQKPFLCARYRIGVASTTFTHPSAAQRPRLFGQVHPAVVDGFGKIGASTGLILFQVAKCVLISGYNPPRFAVLSCWMGNLRRAIAI